MLLGETLMVWVHCKLLKYFISVLLAILNEETSTLKTMHYHVFMILSNYSSYEDCCCDICLFNEFWVTPLPFLLVNEV